MSNSTDSSASKSLRRAVSDPEEMVGHVIDERYRLKRFISQGGMGAVFEAEHVTIQKSIAVKILHPSLVQVPELVQRFEREAFAIGRIDHPNCIRVSDFGKLDDGALFLVMEFLDGVSLADRIDDGGPLSTEHALRILRHVVRGLAHVHRAGIVHRDVKPENIVLVDKDDDEDFAKLLDFGIAKLVGEAQRPDDHQLTQAGIAFGTPNYMSPEQTLGDSVDGRSDLYQATVVLFEMLAGRPPFRSDDKLELMSMHASRPPPPVTDFNPNANVTSKVQALLDCGLAKRVSERYQSAKDYLQAIDEAIIDLGAKLPARVDTPLPSPAGGRSPTGHTITATQALPLPHKRNVKLFIALGLGFLLVGLILLTLAARKGERSQAAETRPDAAPAKSAATLAGEALERGKPKEAIAVLTTDGVDISTDAQGQLLLGHAHAARNHAKQTLAAYRKAIELDSTLAEDAALNANLKVLAADKRTFEEAATMLIEELDDKQIKGQVLAKATTKGDGEWRHLALGLSEKLGFIDEVDLRSVYELDLAEGSRCGYRQAAVAKLRALGDPAAIPALQKAINRRGTRGRWRGRKINSCLADDAKKAIQYLRTLSKSP